MLATAILEWNSVGGSGKALLWPSEWDDVVDDVLRHIIYTTTTTVDRRSPGTTAAAVERTSMKPTDQMEYGPDVIDIVTRPTTNVDGGGGEAGME